MDKICCRFARVSPIYIKFRINLIDILLNTAFGQDQSFRNFAVTQRSFIRPKISYSLVSFSSVVILVDFSLSAACGVSSVAEVGGSGRPA